MELLQKQYFQKIVPQIAYKILKRTLSPLYYIRSAVGLNVDSNQLMQLEQFCKMQETESTIESQVQLTRKNLHPSLNLLKELSDFLR